MNARRTTARDSWLATLERRESRKYLADPVPPTGFDDPIDFPRTPEQIDEDARDYRDEWRFERDREERSRT